MVLSLTGRSLVCAALALCFLAQPALALDWELIGTQDGVEVFTARAGSTIRVGFKNTNSHAVRVDVDGDDAFIWCGGTYSGQGERQTDTIGDFVLQPGEKNADPGWNHYGCSSDLPFYFEIGITVERL